MRSLPFTALLVALAAPFVSSQSLSDLPACAQNAGLASIQESGCTITDVACLCSKASVVDSLRAAILQACSAEDQTAALAFANTLCGAAGSSSMNPAVTASMPDMSSVPESTPGSMMSSMSSVSVAYTAQTETSASTTSMMNVSMHTPSSSASGNMSMSSTSKDASMSMSMTASPSQFTGGAPSRASSLEREWLLPAVAIAGIVVAAL